MLINCEQLNKPDISLHCCFYITSDNVQAFGDLVYPVMFGGDKPGQDKVDKLKEVLGWMDGFVADDKFAAGTSNLTLADIALVATYSTLKVTELRRR